MTTQPTRPVGGHPADRPGPFVLAEEPAGLDALALADADRHHLERVLRLRAGDPLTVGDGRGRWCTARFGDDLEATSAVHEAAPSTRELAVGFALVKGDKPELIVQKLTELGIDRIVPFRAERSVVRWDAAKASKAVGRLRAVARAAAMQCHRPWLPVVHDLTDVGALAGDGRVAFAERGGVALGAEHEFVLIGPEGGWAPGERPVDATAVALGGHVLRAETAAIAAATLMTAHRDGRLGHST